MQLQLQEQRLDIPWLHRDKVQLSMLRADLVDPLLSGNKYFKLKYNLEEARRQRAHTLLSFGGAWSNHLHALAAAGRREGFATVGVVRGEEPAELNPCLADAGAMGMRLHFVSREQYRDRHAPAFLERLRGLFGPCFVIPEGGANLAGIRGCQELLSDELAGKYSHVMLACGSGTTMAGLVSSIRTPVIGIQVLKGEAYLQREIQRMLELYGLRALAPWRVLDGYHRGGYAKLDDELRDFLRRMRQSGEVPLEPVYSGKLLLAVRDLVAADFFPPGARLLLLHGGGLQGLRGFEASL